MGKKAKLRKSSLAFTATPEFSISDPAFAEFLRMSGISTTSMTEDRAAGLAAWWRCQSIIAGTIAGLPLKVYSSSGDVRTEVNEHWLTNRPCGPYAISGFSWAEMVVLHLLNHGEAFLKHLHNGAGAVVGLYPIHPLAITKVEWSGADKVFTVATTGGRQEVLDTTEVEHVMGPTMDGTRGMSPLALFRRTLQTTDAGEVAANRTFTSGSLISGLVSSEEDIEEEDAKEIASALRSKLKGPDSAGDIAFVNRHLKFTPWVSTNKDAEFLMSRAFQVEEVARIFGIPTSLLSVSGAVSNWGTGVAEANAGLHRYVLAGWTSRLESTLNRLIAPLTCEFEYKGLLQGTPKEEVELLVAQVGAGLLTRDEARAITNRPPMPEPDIPPPPAIPASVTASRALPLSDMTIPDKELVHG